MGKNGDVTGNTKHISVAHLKSKTSWTDGWSENIYYKKKLNNVRNVKKNQKIDWDMRVS